MQYTVDTSKEIDWQAVGVNLTVQNVANIIRTFKYEVGYLRTLGLPRELLDMPLSQSRGRLVTAITEQITLYEPNIKVLSVDVLSVTADGNLQVRVVLEL